MKISKLLTKRQRRGAAIIEAALVIPILILLTLGALKYGWIYYRLQQATNVTRQAARLAIRPWATNSGVEAEIDSQMALAGMAYADVAYSKSVSCEITAGNAVTVSLTLPTSSNKIDIMQFGGPLPLLPTPRDLVISVTMSKEGPIVPPTVP